MNVFRRSETEGLPRSPVDSLSPTASRQSAIPSDTSPTGCPATGLDATLEHSWNILGTLLPIQGHNAYNPRATIGATQVQQSPSISASKSLKVSSRSGGRTRTARKGHRILSPVRLPIPPSGQACLIDSPSLFVVRPSLLDIRLTPVHL